MPKTEPTADAKLLADKLPRYDMNCYEEDEAVIPELSPYGSWVRYEDVVQAERQLYVQTPTSQALAKAIADAFGADLGYAMKKVSVRVYDDGQGVPLVEFCNDIAARISKSE